MRNYQAASELTRIARLSAFNVQGATRRRLNQHSSLYSFPDGSRLQIDATKSQASAWHISWRGTAEDIHLGPIMNRPVSINKQS